MASCCGFSCFACWGPSPFSKKAAVLYVMFNRCEFLFFQFMLWFLWVKCAHLSHWNQWNLKVLNFDRIAIQILTLCIVQQLIRQEGVKLLCLQRPFQILKQLLQKWMYVSIATIDIMNCKPVFKKTDGTVLRFTVPCPISGSLALERQLYLNSVLISFAVN